MSSKLFGLVPEPHLSRNFSVRIGLSNYFLLLLLFSGQQIGRETKSSRRGGKIRKKEKQEGTTGIEEPISFWANISQPWKVDLGPKDGSFTLEMDNIGIPGSLGVCPLQNGTNQNWVYGTLISLEKFY